MSEEGTGTGTGQRSLFEIVFSYSTAEDGDGKRGFSDNRVRVVALTYAQVSQWIADYMSRTGGNPVSPEEADSFKVTRIGPAPFLVDG